MIICYNTKQFCLLTVLSDVSLGAQSRILNQQANKSWEIHGQKNSLTKSSFIISKILFIDPFLSKFQIEHMKMITDSTFSFSLPLGLFLTYTLSSVQFSCSVVSDSLRPHEPQHTRPPCPSPTPRVHPYPCPSSQCCHPTISSSVVLFSPCPQSFPASRSFQISQLFPLGGQTIGV